MTELLLHIPLIKDWWEARQMHKRDIFVAVILEKERKRLHKKQSAYVT